MKKYLIYKKIGIEWFEELPVHWEVGQLKFMLENNDGGVWGDDTEHNNVVVLRSTEITVDGKWRIENPAKRTLNNKEIKKASLKSGDLLITKSSGSEAHIGKTALVTSEIEKLKPCFSNFMQRIHPKPVMDSQYLYYFLNSYLAREQYNYFSTTTTGLANLNTEIIGNLRIPYPPLNEQKNIADFLEYKTFQIEELIAKKQRQNELLHEYRAALINQAVTKGLDPDVPMKDSGFEWLGEIPENWQLTRLKYLADIRYGLGQPPEEAVDGLPFIRATNIKRGRISSKDLLFVNPSDLPISRNPFLKIGEIIVVRSGAYTADSAIINPEYSGAIAGYDMVLTPENINPKFLGFSMLSHYVLDIQLYEKKTRAAQPHLNREELGETLLVHPKSYEEQEEIVSYVDDLDKKITCIIKGNKRQIDLLQDFRLTLISNTVTGKIDVRDWGK
jgi:type I restriction enzyme, S subunit